MQIIIEKTDRKNFLFLSFMAGSFLGLVEALLVIIFGPIVLANQIPRSAESSIVLVLYAALGYAFFSFLISVIVWNYLERRNTTKNLWVIAISIPFGLFITLFVIPFIEGGFFNFILFVLAAILMGIAAALLLQKIINRLKIRSNPGWLLLAFHSILLSLITLTIALKYFSNLEMWVGICIFAIILIAAFSLIRSSKYKTKVLGLGILNLVVLLIGILWLYFPNAKTNDSSSPNILLITIDTLRPDHLGCYGYENARTPNIDKLAQSSILFTNVLAPGPRTGPSHISILTGLNPGNHGALRNYMWISSNAVTLPEILNGNGYNSAAFVSGFPLKNESSGLASRFQMYEDDLSTIPWLPELAMKLRMYNCIRILFDKLSINTVSNERKAVVTTDDALEWLQNRSREPFFLWIHYFDCHIPYEPPGRFQNEKINGNGRMSRVDWLKYKAATREELTRNVSNLDQIIRLYDGEIAYVDEQIGRILNELKQIGIFDNTLIMITADHGESLGEHGYYFDHSDLYNVCLKVPLIMQYPNGGWESKIISNQVRLIDIVPTILDVTDKPLEFKNDGVSLLPLIQDLKMTRDKPAFANLIENNRRLLGVIHKNYKLIWNSPEWIGPQRMSAKEELYDLNADSEEKFNLSGDSLAITSTLNKFLDSLKNEKTVVQRNLNKQARKQLKSLGYIK